MACWYCRKDVHRKARFCRSCNVRAPAGAVLKLSVRKDGFLSSAKILFNGRALNMAFVRKGDRD